MAQPYLIAGALGVLVTVAFYEGRSALNGAGRPPPSSSAVETARRNRAYEDREAAYQKVVDALMQCEDRLAQRAKEMVPAADESPAAPAEPPPPYAGDRFDPGPDEWKALADEGRVKLSRPCTMTEDWLPGEDELRSVGLASNDAQAVADAYKASAARTWEVTRTNCAEWLGVDARVAERIGAATCESLLDMAAQKDEKVFRRVAEARAGRRPESSLPPVERYYLAKTKELKEFESDLSKRLGSEVTRRITESTTFCMYRELWPEMPQ